MSIPGRQNINVGLPNESANSDSLYTAFTKVDQNFANLFACSSPYNTFTAGPGVTVNANANLGTVTITNTGVTNIIAGTNIVINQSNGNVTISATGTGSGNGLSSVGINPISTDRLVVTNTPLVTNGNMTIDLATSGVTQGTYNNPTLTVDSYGRIVSAANGNIAGTVTSVGLTTTPGSGIQISGGPITSNGNITVTNTGVTRINAGSGIVVSSGNGNVTISAASLGGTVTSVGVASDQLVVTGSPVVSSGTINVNLPANVVFNNINANGGNINGNLVITGNISPAANNKVGGIKPGPGVDISLDGELTIDTANLPLSFGDFTANNNILSIVNVDEDMILATDGNATIKLVGNIEFVKTDGIPGTGNIFISATNEGFMTIYAPTIPSNSSGALNIVGSSDGNYQPVLGAGGMMHITGNENSSTKITVDGFGVPGFASIVGRSARGTATTPTPTQTNDVMLRISALGWAEPGYNTSNTGGPPTSIDFVATDNYTSNTYGSKITFYTSRQGTGNISRTLSATIDSVGITTGNVTAGNLVLPTGNIIYTPRYGSFYSNVDQTNPVANTAMAMTFNNTFSANGVSVVSNSRLTVAKTGTYNIQFSAQIAKTGGGTTTVDIWLNKNGTPVDWTNTSLPVTSGSPQVAAWNFIETATTANTYFELMWSSPDTLVTLEASAANTSPTRPGIPSVIVSVTPVGA